MGILISFIILLFLIFIGLPFGLVFFAVALLFAHFAGYDPFFFLVMAGYESARGVLLIAVPLFIFTGELMLQTGLAERLVSLAENLFRKFKVRVEVSVGIVTNISCALFGAVSGSTAATASCIGSIMIPRILARGHKPEYAASLLAASSILGILIPPSIPMIVYGWSSGVSIAALFLGGIMPGLMIMVGLSIFHTVASFYRAKKQPFSSTYSKEPLKTTTYSTTRTVIYNSLALFMPVIVLGSIYGGIATPTEAAAISLAYTIILGFFVYKSLSLNEFINSTANAAAKSSAIMFNLFGIQILARIFISENIPQIIASFLLGVSPTKYVVLILINVFLLFLGMFTSVATGVLISVPLLLTTITRLGMDPLHFGVLMVVNLGIGYITPPVAGSLYIGQLIAGADLKDMMPIIILMILTVFIPIILLITFIPGISTYLPRLLMGYS